MKTQEQKQEVKHAALPFVPTESEDGFEISNNEGAIALMYDLNGNGKRAAENTRDFIVKACNSHYDLVEALKYALAIADDDRYGDVTRRIKHALAKAEGR